LLSILSNQAHAVEAGIIAVPSIGAPNMDMPKPVITSPNMGIPPAARPPVEPAGNSNQALNQTGNISTDQTQSAGVLPDDVSGKWSIKFDNRTDSSLDLTLWSSAGNKIMGYGILTKEGKENSVTASGSFVEMQLALSVKSAQPEYSGQKYDEYDLNLYMENNTLSGTYVQRSGGEFSGDGNARAVKR
jgi:hypothetical protein